MLDDKDVMKFQAYILYSKNVDNILRRIVNYLGNCNKIIADIELSDILKGICVESEPPHFMEFKDCKMVEEVINNEVIGKGIVFRVTSPRSDVHAIAFIPINSFNKSVVLKR